jgi:hypothetical protein
MVAAPASAAITESQAIGIVFKAMRRVNPEQSQRCISLMVERKSRHVFDIAVREKHGASCPGDPLVSPIVERFRVNRSPAQLWLYDMVDETYRRLPL